ncbi:MAG: hypothetical protein WAW50_08645, partial [Trichococcus flocculiformis]
LTTPIFTASASEAAVSAAESVFESLLPQAAKNRVSAATPENKTFFFLMIDFLRFCFFYISD